MASFLGVMWLPSIQDEEIDSDRISK
jgi:hypothetical protein